MLIDRMTVLVKLKGFLNGELSKEEVYHWALSKAVSEEFLNLPQIDPLLFETLQALVDINHEDAEVIFTREDLEYYQRCLEGNEEFNSLRAKRTQNKPRAVPKKFFIDLDLIARIYVVMFGICSVIIHFVGIFIPNFLRMNINPPSRLDSFLDSLPHFVYAVFLFLSPKVLARGNLYYVALMASTFGIFYYVNLTFNIVKALGVHILVVLVLLPYGGLPAALALYLLFKARKSYLAFEMPRQNATGS